MDTLIVALRVILSLGVVLALLWYMQRRLSKVTRGSQILNLVTVVGRQAVGAKSSVVVVDVDGQRLTLGVTDQSVTVLHTSTTPGAPAAHAPDASGAAEFARLLGLVSETDAAPGPTAPAHASVAPTSVAPATPARPANRFAGSILSPSTWQQTAAALRQGR